MSRSQRIAIVVAGVVAVVVAFVVLSPGDDSSDTEPAGATTTPTTATTTETTPTTGTTTTAKPPAPRTPLLTRGKVREIEVSKGDVVRFRVRSSVPEEVHVHGYDITRAVPAGHTTRLAFTANLEGIFEIELHKSHAQIGKLVVEP
jgi:FtsP/CotA-like multicopper oxidase with cupredoxin domain